MPNYGLPLVFKAINVETGEEESCAELPLEDRTFTVWDHGVLTMFHGTKYQLMQQTGFTDAAGKDVYFGDVVIHSSSIDECLALVKISDRGEIQAVRILDKDDSVFSANLLKCFHIVGNAYETPSKWLERARAIWPDAQLPEGVRG